MVRVGVIWISASCFHQEQNTGLSSQKYMVHMKYTQILLHMKKGYCTTINKDMSWDAVCVEVWGLLSPLAITFHPSLLLLNSETMRRDTGLCARLICLLLHLKKHVRVLPAPALTMKEGGAREKPFCAKGALQWVQISNFKTHCLLILPTPLRWQN